MMACCVTSNAPYPPAHVIEVGAVVLAHDEKLAAVAEHGGADARLFEPGVLLHDGNVPAIELPQLSVALLHNFLTAGNVEEAGDFLIHVALPQGARERDDVLARVVGDEKPGGGFQLLGGFGDVAQLEVRNFTGERQVAGAVEQAAVVAIPAPRQNERGDFHDLVAFGADRVEHHQLLQHPVRRKFFRGEIGEGEIADFARGSGFFQEFQNGGFIELGQIISAPFIQAGRCMGRRLSCFSPIESRRSLVAEVRKGFEAGRAGRHPFGTEFLQRQCVPGDIEQLVVAFLLPILKRILVKQVQVFGDLGLPEHLFVFLTRSANHPCNQRGGGRQMVGGER